MANDSVVAVKLDECFLCRLLCSEPVLSPPLAELRARINGHRREDIRVRRECTGGIIEASLKGSKLPDNVVAVLIPGPVEDVVDQEEQLQGTILVLIEPFQTCNTRYILLYTISDGKAYPNSHIRGSQQYLPSPAQVQYKLHRRASRRLDS